MMGKIGNAYKMLMEKPLGTLRSRWKGNDKSKEIDPKVVGYKERMDGADSGRYLVVVTCTSSVESWVLPPQFFCSHLWGENMSVNCGTSCSSPR
jgi:hypothetical protein